MELKTEDKVEKEYVRVMNHVDFSSEAVLVKMEDVFKNVLAMSPVVVRLKHTGSFSTDFVQKFNIMFNTYANLRIEM